MTMILPWWASSHAPSHVRKLPTLHLLGMGPLGCEPDADGHADYGGHRNASQPVRPVAVDVQNALLLGVSRARGDGANVGLRRHLDPLRGHAASQQHHQDEEDELHFRTTIRIDDGKWL